MADPTWRYRVGNEERGPVTADEICALLAQGAIALQTPVWCAAVNKWITAEIVPGFRQAAARAAGVAVPALPPIEEPTKEKLEEITVPLEAVTESAPETMPQAEAPAPAEAQPATVVAPTVQQNDPAPAPAFAAPASVPFVDASSYLPHPWIRFWARSVDWCFSLIGLVLFSAVAIVALGGHPLSMMMTLAICVGWWIVYLVAEAFMLAAFGTTPGKALLGVYVECERGCRPRFGQALSRSIQVWIFGEGLGIPVLSWMTRLIWLVLVSSTGQTIWDRNTYCRVRHQPCHFVRVASVVTMFCLIPALLFAAAIFMAVSHQPDIRKSTFALKDLLQSKGQIAVKPSKLIASHPSVAVVPHATPNTDAKPAAKPAPVIPVKTAPADDRMHQLSGAWVIIVNQQTSKGTVHWKNSLILQEDGTFRQKIRAARHNVEQSDFSQDWAGNWAIKNNQLIETVTVSTTPQHPSGKYVFNLTSDAGSITMQLQADPAGAAAGGSRPSYKFHKAMAVAVTTE